VAKATGRDVASFAGIVEFASRKISEEAEAYSDLAVRLGFIGNEGKRGGTGLRIVGDEALSAALGVRTLSIEADNLLASLSRLPASADPIAGRIAAGANNAAAAPPPADPVIRLPRIEGLDGSDKTADTVRTFAEVVKALRKELAALDADQVVGLATPFETARAKATAFEAAIREANRTAGAGAPQVRALAVEMKALEAAANADAVRGFDAAGGALALHAPQYAAQVDALVQSLFRARLSADEAALGVAALDRVVPVAAVNAEGLATAAERAAEATGAPLSFDPDLMECNLGALQGQPRGEFVHEYFEGRWSPPGGETYAVFSARVWAAMARAADGPGVLIVAHGGLWHAAGRHVPITPRLWPMPNALPIRVTPGPEGWRAEPLG